MATVTYLSFQSGKIIKVSGQDVLHQIERTEKKTFARLEAFAFSTELKKRNHELIVIADDVVTHECKVALVAYMVIAHAKNTNMVHLHKICVQKGFRRQGVGARLLIAYIEKLKKQGAVQIQLWFDESNTPARLLYEKVGFEEVRRLDNYYASSRVGMRIALPTCS